MRVIYMGTPDFAVPCLKKLIQEGHEIAAVFTQPDKPKGRGNRLTMSPVKELALLKEIPVYQPTSLKDAEVVELIKKLAPDMIVVVAYGRILTKEILDIPPFGCINVHASLLPKYRGAAPINWAIINGEKESGVTTMYMDVGLDTGDMILKETTEIGETETAGQLHDRLSLLGAECLSKTIALIERGEVERIPQGEEEATYAPIMKKDLGKIDWQREAEEIRNLIRGTVPWPSAFTTYQGNMVKIWKSHVEPGPKDIIPGKIHRVTKELIYVATGKDLLAIEELQFSGGKRMTVKEYLIGNTIDEDTVLGVD